MDLIFLKSKCVLIERGKLILTLITCCNIYYILDRVFRSLDCLKFTFAQLIIKSKPMFSCKIAEIAMKRLFLLAKGGNDDG